MQFLIERKAPRTGFTERIFYEGPRSGVPKGWHIVH